MSDEEITKLYEDWQASIKESVDNRNDGHFLARQLSAQARYDRARKLQIRDLNAERADLQKTADSLKRRCVQSDWLDSEAAKQLAAVQSKMLEAK